MSETTSEVNRRSATSYDQATSETGTSNGTVAGNSTAERVAVGVETATKSNESKAANQSTQVTVASEDSNNTRNRNASNTSTAAKSSGSEGSSESIGKTNGTSTENRESKTVRELTSKSVRTGGSNQKANIGCTISFTIPILGRVPTNSTSC